MSCSSWSLGGYVASENAYVIFSERAQAGGRTVINLQGSHSLASVGKGDATLELLADCGFVCVTGDLSQTTTQGTYGNDTARTRVGQLKSFVQGSVFPMAAASGKVCLLGASGGAAAAINYARQNPSNVAAMYLVVPLVDIAAAYADAARLAAAGVTQAEMNKAYNGGVDDGGTAFNAAMPTHDPSASGNQAALSGIPMKLVYSTSDTVIPQASVTAYAALVNAAGGSAVTASEGAVGHSAAGIDRQDVVSFFQAHS